MRMGKEAKIKDDGWNCICSNNSCSSHIIFAYSEKENPAKRRSRAACWVTLPSKAMCMPSS